MPEGSIKPASKYDGSYAPSLNYIGFRPSKKFNKQCLKQDKVIFSHKNIVAIYIVYEINFCLFKQSADFTLGNYLFRAVKKSKNFYFDKYKHFGYGIGLDTYGSFSLSDGSGFGQNLIIFGAAMISSVPVDNGKKDILIPGKGPTQDLDITTLTREKECFINFSEINFGLSLHYNGLNSYLFVNGVEMCKFKAKDSEINVAPLCLGNVSKNFSTDNMKETGLHGYFYDFAVDYDITDVDDILNEKQMFGFIKKSVY